MSLALNSKPASQKESINMVQPYMTASARYSCSWKTIFYSAFSWICVCLQRIENHCIYSVSRWGPTRVLRFVRWIQITCLSSFYTFTLFSPLCIYTLFSVAAHSGHFSWDCFSLWAPLSMYLVCTLLLPALVLRGPPALHPCLTLCAGAPRGKFQSIAPSVTTQSP